VPVVTAAEVSREFEPDTLAVSQARRFLRQALQDLLGDDDGSELADTLLIAANELTTNAVLHARTEFVVRVVVDAVRVRVEVTDGNSRVPQPCLAPADATSGRRSGDHRRQRPAAGHRPASRRQNRMATSATRRRLIEPGRARVRW